MHDMAGGNEPAQPVANGAGTWVARVRNVAGAAGSSRRRVATALMCVAVLFPVWASVGCGNGHSYPPVPAEAYMSKPSGNLAPGDEINVTFSGAP